MNALAQSEYILCVMSVSLAQRVPAHAHGGRSEQCTFQHCVRRSMRGPSSTSEGSKGVRAGGQGEHARDEGQLVRVTRGAG